MFEEFFNIKCLLIDFTVPILEYQKSLKITYITCMNMCFMNLCLCIVNSQRLFCSKKFGVKLCKDSFDLFEIIIELFKYNFMLSIKKKLL